MTRVPLRPLARILDARARGQNPDDIERENLRLRHEVMRDKSRRRAEGRLLVMGLIFVCSFGAVALKMGQMANSAATEPRASASGSRVYAQRGDIVDRDGRILATNMATYSLYAHPHLMVDPAHVAHELAQIFPDMDEAAMVRRFTNPNTKFIWLRQTLSPEQRQAVHNIGSPGLLFGPRDMRLYPNGPIASHVLGGVRFGTEDVNWAEIKGVAGVEHSFDKALTDPENQGRPLQLSLDLSVQAALEQVLQGGMKIMHAKGAAAVLMDVHTGEVVAMASLPDFDPNKRPRPLTSGQAEDSPLFNRAVQGVYELGSVFKVFDIADALNLGLVKPDTVIDITGPIRWGRFSISDDHYIGKEASVSKILEESSNIGAARIAQKIGTDRQKAFLKSLGLFAPSPIQLSEAAGARPEITKNWSELTTITVSYGHGIAVSPVMLASAYASIVNGGTLIKPTLLKRTTPQDGPRVVSQQVSEEMRKMMRLVVSDGTAHYGDVPGYDVGGKTGTADKAKPTGGYYHHKEISTFASIFPARDPKYTLVVMLDEPWTHIYGADRRTAGWTTVPVTAEIIRRIGPLLGLRPSVEPDDGADITVSKN